MFVLCLFILAVLHGVKGQADCTPNAVTDIRLDADDVLHWLPSTNCENIKYIIYVTPVGEEATNVFETFSTQVFVGLLPMCELFLFRVVAVAQDTNTASREGVLRAQVPTKPGANVTVTHMHATYQYDNRVILEWELDPLYAHCAQFFRVVRWDFESQPISTYATYNYIHLVGFVPCGQYELTVTPIYNDLEEGGIGLLQYDTPGNNSQLPTLLEVRPGPTFIDMTWELPPYAVNRCTIRSIIVDGSPYVNLVVPITDSAARPPVRIHVESLQPDRMYMFRVSVVNTAGTSPPIPIGIQTLPATN